MLTLQEFEKLPDEEKKNLRSVVLRQTNGMKFIPNPGAQTEAFFSKADIMLYGGAAGGGKSFLINGLAATQHQRSLILRRRYADLGALAEEAVKMNGTRSGFTSMPRPKLKTFDGRLIEFGACQHPGDEESWQGQPHDLICFDEVTQFLEMQVRYLMGWNRTSVEGQRCRVVMASNPPTSADGDWIIGFFRPWLDPTHSNPAKPGELRWFVVDPDGKDMEVPDKTPVEFAGRKEPVIPKSRTFTPAKIADNPYLVKTDYISTLDAMPEPLRSAMRDGNFMLARQDDAFQVIPSEWVKQAIVRWHTNRPHAGTPMCAIGVDIAQGGADDTVLAIRYDAWFDKLIRVPGKQTPQGTDIAALVMKHRRGNPAIILDMGGGYGGAAREHLIANEIAVVPFKGAESATGLSTEDKLKYTNKRSQAWWQFRKALDPAQPGGSQICLPDDPKLLADLTAPTFEVGSGGIKVEPKEKVCDRLGRSTDAGDAVVMSWHSGPKGMAMSHPSQRPTAEQKFKPKIIHGYANRKRSLKN